MKTKTWFRISKIMDVTASLVLVSWLGWAIWHGAWDEAAMAAWFSLYAIFDRSSEPSAYEEIDRVRWTRNMRLGGAFFFADVAFAAHCYHAAREAADPLRGAAFGVVAVCAAWIAWMGVSRIYAIRDALAAKS